MSFRPVATHINDFSVAVSPCRIGEETPLLEEQSALTAMVDFHWVCPVTVDPGQKIAAALQSMIGARVRTLLVIAEGHMIGLITSYDIEGPKPLQFLSGYGCIHAKCQHEDIEVADIMTPVDALPTLRFEDVGKARIGDIVETFRETRRTHLLITDRPDDGRVLVRGLISGTEIERRLGMSSAHVSAARIALETSVFSRLTA
jgi:hypothetical protein